MTKITGIVTTRGNAKRSTRYQSRDQNSGYLLSRGDYETTQLYGDCFISHELRIPFNQSGLNGMSTGFGSRCSSAIFEGSGFLGRS